MIETTKLPKELVTDNRDSHFSTGLKFISDPEVTKRTLNGIDEIQYLHVAPWTTIKMHGHNNQWEIWIRPDTKSAYVCLKDEEHELINHSSSSMSFIAIKGHLDYSYEDLADFFEKWEISVSHGSFVVNED